MLREHLGGKGSGDFSTNPKVANGKACIGTVTSDHFRVSDQFRVALLQPGNHFRVSDQFRVALLQPGKFQKWLSEVTMPMQKWLSEVTIPQQKCFSEVSRRKQTHG